MLVNELRAAFQGLRNFALIVGSGPYARAVLGISHEHVRRLVDHFPVAFANRLVPLIFFRGSVGAGG